MAKAIDRVPNGAIAMIDERLYLSTSGVAAYFGWTVEDVYARRKLGLGPQPIKIGHGNWYPYRESDEWRGEWFEGGAAEPEARRDEFSAHGAASGEVMPPRSVAARKLEEELRQIIITDVTKHRAFLFMCMEKVATMELDAVRANAVVGLSAEVHKSMKQSTDMFRELNVISDDM